MRCYMRDVRANNSVMNKASCVCPKKDIVPQAVLDNAKIPAVSAAWYQNGETHSLVSGVLDRSNPIPLMKHHYFKRHR